MGGTWRTGKFFHIDGEQEISCGQWMSPPGGIIFGSLSLIIWCPVVNIFWQPHVLRMNTLNLSDIMVVPVGGTYGLGMDFIGHLFVGGGGLLTKIDVNDKINPIMWQFGFQQIRVLRVHLITMYGQRV